MKVKIKKLHPDASMPTQGSKQAAGWDLYAYGNGVYSGFTQVTYSTGLAIEIPKGYVGKIYPRSSISKVNLRLCNSVGIIDSDYRGEIKFVFDILEADNSSRPTVYQNGDRIGQLIIEESPKIEWKEVKELSKTDRDQGGFGSTGK